MLNLNQIFYPLKKATIAMLFIMPVSSYAQPTVTSEDVDLICCTAETCPTTFTSKGEPGVQQGVTVKGVRLEPNEEVVTMYDGAPGFEDWFSDLRKMPDKANAMGIFKRSSAASSASTSILVDCSSAGSVEVVRGVGDSIVCPVGDSIKLKQDHLKCTEGHTPSMVVTLTKTKEESPELAALRARRAELMEKRDRKIEENRLLGEEIRADHQRIAVTDQEIEALKEEVIKGILESDSMQEFLRGEFGSVLSKIVPEVVREAMEDESIVDRQGFIDRAKRLLELRLRALNINPSANQNQRVNAVREGENRGRRGILGRLGRGLHTAVKTATPRS
ncbi:MAG: hypothetical protein KKE11_03800 [Gammaproteobacteria bacterium]|nr:hypothetical protein [Gammaproteobacteria bacterium]